MVGTAADPPTAVGFDGSSGGGCAFAGREDVLSRVGKRTGPRLTYPLETRDGVVRLVLFREIGLERYSVYFPVSE